MGSILSVKSTERWVFNNHKKGKAYNFDIDSSSYHWLPRRIRSSSYTQENKKAVQQFKKAMEARIGPDRLKRISSIHGVDLDSMEAQGSPLLTRDVLRITIGVQDVRIEDIEELIQLCKTTEDPNLLPSAIPLELHALLRQDHIHSFRDLSSREFFLVHRSLQSGMNNFQISVNKKTASRKKYNESLVTLERLFLTSHKPFKDEESFYHYMVSRVMKRELHVGALIPGYSIYGMTTDFYYVAGKLVTGKGMVSYILLPVNPHSYLKPLRFFRGTATEPSELDVEQTMESDVQHSIGEMPYKSAEKYDEQIDKLFPHTEMIYIGHSLGSSTVQHYVANHKVTEAYLYNGPGIDLEKVQSFNDQMKAAPNTRVILHIRNTEGDSLSALGDAHIGFAAPPNVEIDFRKYVPRKKVHNVHVFAFPHESANSHEYRVLTNRAVDLNAELDHRKKSPIVEWLRKKVGWLAKKLFLLFKRGLQNSIQRTRAQQGLQYGLMTPQGWKVTHVH